MVKSLGLPVGATVLVGDDEGEGVVVGVDDGDALGKVVALGRTVGDTVLVGDDEREGVAVGKALTDGDWVGHPSPNRIEVSEDPNSPPSAMITSS